MRIQGLETYCFVCGVTEEDDQHVFLGCPLAVEVWDGCGLGRFKPDQGGINPRQWLEHQADNVDLDTLGFLVAILSEIWNARNRFVFGTPDREPKILRLRAIEFVQNFHSSKDKL